MLSSLFLRLVFYSPPLFLQKTYPDSLLARGNCGYRVLAPSTTVPTCKNLSISALILIFFLAVSEKELVVLLQVSPIFYHIFRILTPLFYLSSLVLGLSPLHNLTIFMLKITKNKFLKATALTSLPSSYYRI